ncbi:cysteine desulfurase NifS [candidate division WOR-3 bacterium JGI_Cruoil_03_44_89]|uniref:Cysteine desulfurase n=1 Tax=candidate division WOR-3 bacterium JGI_Cruoil_03_44_89 TaxID=1973748 RepID=A0A235BZ43_UNCW3|nr:MAG: cysteine desulfurase NifS [candidate division WOR-3 bacterium JGI_Cruoil_03_44_89]
MIYLDHNSSTRVDERVLSKMLPYFRKGFANPSSTYKIAQKAREAVEDARETVAKCLGCEPEEIYFTSGGTESNNLAIKGVAWRQRHRGNHIITSTIEHHAVLNPFKWLENRGYNVSYIPVDSAGIVDVEALRWAITPETILISVMWVNNEIGTIQPIREIAEIAREKGIYFHTDAVQAVGKIPVNLKEVGVNMLSLSGHKLYGPKGVGALFVRKGTHIEPLIHGGHHEKNLRAGTENVPGIVGLSEAVKIATEELEEENERLLTLRNKLEAGLLARISYITINGHRKKRVSNTLSLCVKYIEGESMLLHLDLNDICASSGSACTAGSPEPSHVLLAMDIEPEVASGSLRFSLGRENTEDDIDKVLDILPKVVEKLRSVSPYK